MIGLLMRRMMSTLNTEPPTPPTPPPYDAIVEYLEGDGTQWIDTNYIPQVGDSLEFDIYTLNNSNAGYQSIISAGDDTNQIGLVWSWTNGTLFFRYFSYIASPALQGYSTNRAYSISISSSGNLVINGTSVTTISPAGAIDGTNKTLRLFYRCNNSMPFYGRISAFKLVSNGTTILDLIPVRIGQVGYMYNRVDGTLLGNAGTGDFILGNDV